MDQSLSLPTPPPSSCPTMFLPVCPASLPYDLVTDKTRGPAMPSARCQHFRFIQKLIQQLFDYPRCLATVLSTKLSPRAVCCLCELGICRLYRLSSSPGRVERLLTPHSHPSVRLPSSRHPPVSCLLSAALWPCHLGDTPDHQGPGGCLGLAGDAPQQGNMGEKCCSVWRSSANSGLVEEEEGG
ncbi:hypothetical protein Q5P01_022540 [Channa striata]|uniref:Uncharacterized protein n=1 Tax=Channa striata TaxID=64152 RepID=A0AA88ISR1_CHASR|nr:hypothetical protein Q5P01_022540 [Channa striata]